VLARNRICHAVARMGYENSLQRSDLILPRTGTKVRLTNRRNHMSYKRKLNFLLKLGIMSTSMHPVSKLVVTVLVLTLAVTLVSSSKGKAQPQAIKPQQPDTPSFQERERAIIKSTEYDAPLSIKAVKTKGRSVPLDKKFIDEDDWLKDLAILVRNDSSKTVTHVGLRLLFQHLSEGKQPPARWLLEYGPNPFFFKTQAAVPPSRVPHILPGGQAELKLNDAEFENLKAFLKRAGFPNNIHVVKVRVNTVGFTDGTAWNGKMLKRDSGGDSGWSIIETASSARYNHTRPTKESSMSRTAGFFLIYSVFSPAYHRRIRLTKC